MTSLDQFVIVKQLGEGTSGRVFLATYKEGSNIHCALKEISKKDKDENTIRSARREIEIMKIIDHPSIIHFFSSFETEESLYVVMEYIHSKTLLEICMNEKPLSEEQSFSYFIEIISALYYLHQKYHIVHRDLKLENILVDKCNHVHLIDFGLSNILESDCLLSTACGSVAYSAPELILREKYNEKVDIWSAGIVLYAMLYGQFPFFDLDVMKTLRSILNDEVMFPNNATDPNVDLLLQMLNKNPLKRISLSMILSHKALTKYFAPKELDSFLNLSDDMLVGRHSSLTDKIKRTTKISLSKGCLHSMSTITKRVSIPISLAQNRNIAPLFANRMHSAVNHRYRNRRISKPNIIVPSL